VLKAESVF
jgi:hypothetical protein